MTVTVIIVTLDRPDCVKRCLTCLSVQAPPAQQVIVVDASAGDLTRKIVDEFKGVVYLRNPNGTGRMTESRNIGLLHSKSEIVSFLDDDAFARPGWLKAIVDGYLNESVGAVGGRALNNQPGEDTEGVERIGTLTRDGNLQGFFAANPKKMIEVDHLMGCNMSFRASVLSSLGGFREDFPGVSGLREDSDMCLRVKMSGHKVIFNPEAVVDHIGAPQVKGRRFDYRYTYFCARNHFVLLARNFGFRQSLIWRYLAKSSFERVLEFIKRLMAATAHFGAFIGGSFAGLMFCVASWHRGFSQSARLDQKGEEIRRHLSAAPGTGYANGVLKAEDDSEPSPNAEIGDNHLSKY